MIDIPMPSKRRKYLILLALGTTGTLAGCTGDGDDDEELEPVGDDNGEGEEEDEDEEDDEVEDEEEDEDEVEDEDEEEDEDEDELRQMDLSFGDTVEHPDGFHITPFEPEIVDSYETETFDDTETIEPENGQFVFIEIEIENVSSSTIETPNPLSFEAIVDNQQYERLSLIGEQPIDYERYGLNDLAPGSIASGELIYDTASGEVELFYSGFTEDFDNVEAIWS